MKSLIDNFINSYIDYKHIGSEFSGLSANWTEDVAFHPGAIVMSKVRTPIELKVNGVIPKATPDLSNLKALYDQS